METTSLENHELGFIESVHENSTTPTSPSTNYSGILLSVRIAKITILYRFQHKIVYTGVMLPFRTYYHLEIL